MRITHLALQDYRGFVPSSLNFSPTVNLLIGANNSGKSSILRAILNLQRPVLNNTDITVHANKAEITFDIVGIDKRIVYHLGDPQRNIILDQFLGSDIRLTTVINANGGVASNFLLTSGGVRQTFPFGFLLGQDEPDNWVYPYLSDRRVVQYLEDVKTQAARSVQGTHAFLYAKIDRLSNPDDPHHLEFREACKDILNVPVSSFPADNGKAAGVVVDTFNSIRLTSMGTGTPQVLGLLADLCVADNNVFLIEEIENDLHPKALKKLLRFLKQKSAKNQVFLTTHSHVVAKYLGRDSDAKLFYIERDSEPKKRIATVKEIAPNPQERLTVLENIGYELFDLDIWNAWLFLEEASAETIIKEYLIPWFIPTLKEKIRTFSARSVDDMPLKFSIFETLLTYVHLQEHVYKNRAWVVVDNDEKGRDVIKKLREKFAKSGWDERNFLTFSQDKFEHYYPGSFSTKIADALKLSHDAARPAKQKLLEEVEQYLQTGGEAAKRELEVSAKDVIEILKQIDASIVRTV